MLSRGLWKLMHSRWRLFQTQRFVSLSYYVVSGGFLISKL
ncbi:hypothetical protein Golax_014478 [Gossypium laxum]|uniref:Uncharacterized protein n=1 Tax=Gossypium laxum TaxID=34288 RepID=A0A7J8ZUU5_9ROSI|nr:hypothetical protein [Gossypium laxum]